MSPEQINLARHALGLSDPKCKRRSYRNRFNASHGTPDCIEWEAMVEAGWAKSRSDRLNDIHPATNFWLTPAGAQLALKAGESLDPEDFPEGVNS